MRTAGYSRAMPTRIIAVAIDCHDAEALAEFWREALDHPAPTRWQDARGLSYVELGREGGPSLLFQPVPESKTVKNRLHLDIAPTEIGQQDEVERLTALGAKVISQAPDQHWIVLADPEGNEFCVLPRRS
jgi:predicted enzyme related to lactoylglutathione lyase